MGRFAGLAGIKTNSGGIYFEVGNYLVKLGQIKYIDNTRSGDDAFVIETTVVESDSPSRGVGSKPSQVITLKKQYLETCLADVKHFTAAVLEIDDPDSYQEAVTAEDQIRATAEGRDPQEVANDRFWEQAIELLVSDEQPAKGMLIYLNCTLRPTQSGKMFTKHFWGPVKPAEG